MTLKDYLTLYLLLKNSNLSHSKNRAFVLSSKLEDKDDLTKLKAWLEVHKNSLKKPLFSDDVTSYLSSITSLLIVVGFIVGVLSGVTLLSYSGNEPVNVVYFIAVAIFLPLVSMLLSLLAMFRTQGLQSTILRVSPAFWLEKILEFLSKNKEIPLRSIEINPLLLNTILIKRTQLVALAFSVGIFLALLGMVVTKDIAFAWSTTLHISPEEFHSFLNALSFAWREWLPQAVPSVELVEHSHYFRLGDKLSEEMIANASNLGEWWKFLAMGTLFYSIVLRFIIYLLSAISSKKALVKSIFTLDGVEKLLNEMNTPIITTTAKELESTFLEESSGYERVADEAKELATITTMGFSYTKEQLALICDTLGVDYNEMYVVGGLNSLEEDERIAKLSQDEVLLFVKAWEPPTLDFMDFLELLCQNRERVTLYPIGLMEDGYTPESRDVDIWARKIAQFDLSKVWLRR